MGFLKSSPPGIDVEVIQSTHGTTFVTYPSHMAMQDNLPALPLGHQHPRSRQWVLADKTAVVILPGDPNIHAGGVIRHTFDVVSSHWNSREKTLTTTLVHPAAPEVHFTVATSGKGCACTQGPAGNAGPIHESYKIVMVNANVPEFDWFTSQ